MRKLICPKCKTLRYTTSKEEHWQCRACGTKIGELPKLLRRKHIKGELARALGLD